MKTKNATIVGQCTTYIEQDIINDLAYDFTNSSTMTAYTLAIIKFVTPKFNGVSASIDVQLLCNFYWNLAGGYDESNRIFNIALCTSDDNYNLYYVHGSNYNPTSDQYQIATTTASVSNSGSSFSISTSKLDGEKEYYLILWKEGITDAHQFNFYASTNHNINVNYIESPISIDTGSKFDIYQCYIDNGSTFQLYTPYIDNGTTWESL